MLKRMTFSLNCLGFVVVVVVVEVLAEGGGEAGIAGKEESNPGVHVASSAAG